MWTMRLTAHRQRPWTTRRVAHRRRLRIIPTAFAHIPTAFAHIPTAFAHIPTAFDLEEEKRRTPGNDIHPLGNIPS
jgi:hypothetical protein